MASFWNLHAEAGWQLHGGHGCHFSPGPLYELLNPRAPPPVHMRGFRRLSTGILNTKYQPRTQWSLTGTGTWMPFENSISDRPSGGTYFLWVTRKAWISASGQAIQGPTFIFPATEHRVFINTIEVTSEAVSCLTLAIVPTPTPLAAPTGRPPRILHSEFSYNRMSWEWTWLKIWAVALGKILGTRGQWSPLGLKQLGVRVKYTPGKDMNAAKCTGGCPRLRQTLREEWNPHWNRALS